MSRATDFSSERGFEPETKQMRMLCVVLVWVLGTLVAAGPAAALGYYVATGGSDAQDGTSPATAWATLQHAANVAAPGDTVHVADGGYTGFYQSRSGAPGQPIVFLADGSNVRITADNDITPDGINIEGASYVVLDGFNVDGRTRAGIRTALSQFVTIRNCRLGYNGRWGIFSGFADDLTIENNETHHSVAEHGIYVSNSGDRPIIRGNHVHDNYANGIHMNGDASQGGDGTISGALVAENVIHGNGAGGGSAINMDGVIDSIVRNNLIYANHASGISLYRIDGATGSTGNVVINNTIVNAADGRWCVNINSGSTGNTLVNNILYNEHPWRGVISIDASSTAGFVSDFNSLMNRFSNDDGNTVIDLAAWRALGWDANSFLAAPADHFVSPGTNFRLLATSPAINAGTATGAPTVDLDGNPRPVGGGYDLGAYEVQNLSCGDGVVDPGEACGEPGLSCADPCTTCAVCACIPAVPVCGDGLVCGTEQCEINADCTSGLVCDGCACVVPALCAGGIPASRPVLRMRSEPFSMRLKGRVVIPKPWIAIDPSLNGVRVVVDGPYGGGVDLPVPGGAFDGTSGWRLNRAGTRWVYRDRGGAAGVVRRVVIKDRSARTDGEIQWVVRAVGGTATLPPPADARASVLLGAPPECALSDWNPPGGSRPRCDGNSTKLRCR